MAGPHFDRTFRSKPGVPTAIAPGIVRLTANNPGPMTFVGTNSYLVGDDPLIVIDPGPDDPNHLEALLATIGARTVTAIAVTHTHRDHSDLAGALSAATGAPVVGAAPHSMARAPVAGDASLDEAADSAYAPQRVLAQGDVVEVGTARLMAVATPGHTMNHLCFALLGTSYLFSGDHVMAWSSTLVAPPEGEMSAYLHSLQALRRRPEQVYLPGHGAWISDAHTFVDGLFAYRMAREDAIVKALAVEALTAADLVERLYLDLDPRLKRAAGLSVLAHLERLEQLGQAVRQRHDASGRWALVGAALDRSD
jgi:glyoxylase-like metal-dependent hydrolase (beta-lactamase superfamily II)